MNFTIKLEGIDKALQLFDSKKVERAAKASLNRVIRSGKTAASDEIRNDLGVNIRKQDLDRKINVTLATGNSLRGEILVTGQPILLTYFNVRAGSIYVAKNKGGAKNFALAERLKGKHGSGEVQVTIMKGKTTTLNNRTFIARGQNSGALMVFTRVGGNHGKLIAKKVYTEASMFRKTMKIVKERIIEQWSKEWSNQIKQLQSGQGWMDRE